MTSDVEIEPFGADGGDYRPAAPLRSVRPRIIEDAWWVPDVGDCDVRVQFRGTFTLTEATELRLDVLAASSFRLYVNAKELVDGPLRYAPAFPEYQSLSVALGAGPHTLGVEVHSAGITTRVTPRLPGFWWAELSSAGSPVPVRWRCRRSGGHWATGVRSSPLQGWIEWSRVPESAEWLAREIGGGWVDPQLVRPFGGPRTISLSGLQLPRWPSAPVEPAAQGMYRETYGGYDLDDVAIAAALTDLNPAPNQAPDGAWYRYDLKRVRIGRLRLVVDSAEPGVVQIGYAERLSPSGTVVPVAAWSAGPTRFVQRFAIAPGRSTLDPLTSYGARHVLVKATASARVVGAEFVERDLLGTPLGSFRCADDELNRLWQVGCDTIRSCTEDAVVDPVRERGEWLGDLVVAMEAIAVTHGDLSVVRRGLVHAAATARPDGLVAGCGPGEVLFLSSYAAMWVSGCLRYAQLTGDTSLLYELLPHADANVRALVGLVDDQGMTGGAPWPFIDWGLPPVPGGQVNGCLLLLIRQSVRDLQQWHTLVGVDPDGVSRVTFQAKVDAAIVRSGVLGTYHGAILAHRGGADTAAASVAMILDHIRSGFPYDLLGPRLASPTKPVEGAVTPYFLNMSLPVLLNHGLTDDVADLWRVGWGWFLDQGMTTYGEVFDDRWSHCHAWSAAPTWQMSRYLLGLHPRLDTHGSSLGLNLVPGSLTWAEGRVPTPEGSVNVAWRREGELIEMSLEADHRLTILVGRRMVCGRQLHLSLAPDSRGRYTTQRSRGLSIGPTKG